jgi:biotin synthase
VLRHDWSLADIEAIYTAPFTDLIVRAQEAQRAYHRADEVQGCALLSIKTGGCPEDCAYCPQSARYDTHVSPTPLMSVAEMRDAAERAKAGPSSTCWRWSASCEASTWRRAARSAC